MADFYQTLFGRRDVRSEFIARELPADTLGRILTAAHHAPSVGLSQPWNFIVIRSRETKLQVLEAFEQANAEARDRMEASRQSLYGRLKLQGIMEAPVNLLVTCDRARGGEVVLGRTHQMDMDLYSTVCAVQNLWLAARAEEVGVGWVSIVKPADIKRIFGLPESVQPVAYLCLGYVSHFEQSPELERRGWKERSPVAGAVFNERWGDSDAADPLHDALRNLTLWVEEQLEPSRAEDD